MLEDDVEVEVLVKLLLVVDEVREVEDVLPYVVEVDDADVDVVPVLVVDVDAVREELQVGPVVEVVEVNVPQVDVELAHVDDDVELEDDVEVEQLVALLLLVVDDVLEVGAVLLDVIEEDEAEVDDHTGRASRRGACAY